MKTRDIINPIANAFPIVAMPRKLSRAASAGVLGLGLFRRKRREPPVFAIAAIAAGVALAGAAAVALLTPSRRTSLRDMLQRMGGGIGKQLGKVLGEQAGAHPQQTAEFVQKTRELIGSSKHATS